jgi:hypothetical protein
MPSKLNSRERTFTNAFRGGFGNRIAMNDVGEVTVDPQGEKISNGDSVDRLVNNIYGLATWAATSGKYIYIVIYTRNSCPPLNLYFYRVDRRLR